MGTGDNTTTVRQCFESAVRGDWGAFDTLLHTDYVLHPEEIRGREGLQRMIEGYRRAVGGMRLTIDGQFADGDHVATRFTIRGRHEGELMGARPTGAELEFSGITISRCQDGMIVEEWELVDVPSLLRQIGALPVPA